MKVTRLITPKPILTLTGLLGGASVGPSGQVPTSDGSNGVAWGSNVAVIFSNGSNALIGPFVNFASGSNILFTLDAGPGGSVPSNTLRIHSTGGGGAGSALTVKDEGSPLSGDATALDFTGAGVTASGTGATKTISIPGGGGAYSPWSVPSSPNGSDKEGSNGSVLTGATDRASVTSSVANELISVIKASATGDRLAGTDWAETMADGDHWTIGIQDGALWQDYQALGMYVCDSTFTEAWSIALVHDGTAGVYPQLKDWTNTGTGAGAATNYQNPGIVGAVLNGGIFLRIKRNSSTSFDNYISFGGKEFRKLSSALNPGFTIARVGIAAFSATNTVDVACHVRFLRKNWNWGN